jgi:hypothetical protein
MDACKVARRAGHVGARWAMAAALVALCCACASAPEGAELASGDGCSAACSRVAPDGETCLQWAAMASSACVARYSAVSQCCGPGDRPLCAVSAPASVGAACVCRGVNRHGPFVLQGSACRSD